MAVRKPNQEAHPLDASDVYQGSLDEFIHQLNFVCSAVSKLIYEQIGIHVPQNIQKDYEASDDALWMITQHKPWHNTHNAQMLCELVIRLFRDIMELPNYLTMDSLHHTHPNANHSLSTHSVLSTMEHAQREQKQPQALQQFLLNKLVSLLNYHIFEDAIVADAKYKFTADQQRALLSPLTQRLARLNQSQFCEWVVDCAQNIIPSKTVQIMLNRLKRKGVNGKRLIKYIKMTSASNQSSFQDFMRNTLMCTDDDDILFIKYFTSRMVSDYENGVPIETYSCDEIAEYVLKQSYYHPSDEFRNRAIDGFKFCFASRKYLVTFLTELCGFREYTAHHLITTLNKYVERMDLQKQKHHLVNAVSNANAPNTTYQVGDEVISMLMHRHKMLNPFQISDLLHFIQVDKNKPQLLWLIFDA
eukprot:1059244_1